MSWLERTGVVRAVPRDARFASLAAGLLIALAAFAASTDALLRPQRIGLDLNAFYCAGRAVDLGADPYRAEPLGACERRPMRPPLPRIDPGVAMPAPIPPYALAPFALLGRLPFPIVVALWSALVTASGAASVIALRRLTALPLAALVAAFALGSLVAIDLGQVAPLATAGIACAAYALARGKPRAAALAATLAMIEPHVGLPACCALWLWVPRTRRALAVAGVACAALSLALVGAPVSRAYVLDVLPLHAFAEIANPQQLSLTYALHRFGASDAVALRAGEVWYAAMVVLGVAAAGRFARRAPELVPSLPVAFAVFGGAFIHAVQVPAALPAALIVLARSGGASRAALALAVACIALPFVQFTSLGACSIPLFGAVAIVLAVALAGLRLVPAVVLGIAASAVPFALTTTQPQGHRPSVAALVAAYDARAPAPRSWRTYFDAVGAGAAWPALDLSKLPMCCGLAIVAAGGFRLARRRGGEREPSPS